MQAQLGQLVRRFSPYWEGLSQAQRLSLGVIAAAALSLAAYLVLQGPEYAPVFTRLDDRDASAIVAKLREGKIDYRLADGGSTILVPASQVHDVRLKLAGEGLPQSGTVGFELFNQPNLGATEFTQKLNYQRALEGELARTIGKLAGVEQARVHLALPQPTLFSDMEKMPTASVVLQLRPGVELTAEQIRGVTHLVATSVEGLTPNNVTLMDTRGRLLASGAEANGVVGGLDATTDQLALQRSYEQRTQRIAQELIDRTLGPGKGLVSASVLLDWERFEANREVFSPDGAEAQLRSSHEVVDTSRSDGATAQGGVPGVEANVAGIYQQVGGGGSSEAERRETTRNYELSKSVERVIRLPGSIKRMSVAVVLDSAVASDQVAEIEKAVAAAVGLDAGRGDVLAVTSVAFDRSAEEAERLALEESRRQELIAQLLQLARVLALPLLGLILLLAMFVTVLRRQAATLPKSLPDPETVVTEVIGGDQPALQEAQRRRLLQEQVAAIAREDPHTISQVIRTWLAEDGKHS